MNRDDNEGEGEDDYRGLSLIDRLGLEGDDGESAAALLSGRWRRGRTNLGFRVGHGNPDAVLFDPDPAPPVIRESAGTVYRRVACHRCGTPFTRSRDRKIYCRACVPGRGRFSPIKPTVCVQCGSHFTPKARAHFRFCSPECGSAYYRVPKKPKHSSGRAPGRPRVLPPVTCQYASCGRVFRAATRGQRYCSSVCKGADQRGKSIKANPHLMLQAVAGGASVAEVAAMFGMTRQGVQKALKRAREGLGG